MVASIKTLNFMSVTGYEIKRDNQYSLKEKYPYSEDVNSNKHPCDYTRAAPAFKIKGGSNSEHFLSNLRKLLKRGKFFLTAQSLIVKRS